MQPTTRTRVAAPAASQPATATPGKPSSLAERVGIPRKAAPMAAILSAKRKWGKTSFLACSPAPILAYVKNETGIDTLIEFGQVDNIPRFPVHSTFEEHLADLTLLRDEAPGSLPYKTLGIDTLNGVETLLKTDICNRKFNGDWGEKGFGQFGRGMKLFYPRWDAYFSLLESIRIKHGMAIILLTHSTVKRAQEPGKPEYDHWVPDMTDGAYNIADRWADCLLFGDFASSVVDDEGAQVAEYERGKAVGANRRVLLCTPKAGFDGGNRFGLPPEIDMEPTPQQGAANFWGAMQEARQRAQERKAQ